MKLLKSFIAVGLLVANINVNAENADTNNPVPVVVYRSPTCGCCEKWIAHLKDNNFVIEDRVTEDIQAIKNKYGVSQEMASCHTAIVDGYVVEGHVPADAIKKLLKIKPHIVGIAVPGMPAGTPGMEMGGKKDPYHVMSFDSKNHTEVFQ